MEVIRVHGFVGKNGTLRVSGLPLPEGEVVEMIVLANRLSRTRASTARRLLKSGLIGLWKDRDDVKDNATFARKLRLMSLSETGN